jgi:predicted acetyltransferase
MPQTALVLRRPRTDEEGEFLWAHHATTAEVPQFLHYYEEGMSLSRYLDVLDDQERGVNLLPNHVPSTFLFAFKGERIIGRVSIRHQLNDFLFRVGGHIGYVVVPEFRRQGHATAMLRLALHLAHDTLGHDHVLVTCDDDNLGSIKTIENNGGVLEDVVRGPDLEKPKRRYWIDARPLER